MSAKVVTLPTLPQDGSALKSGKVRERQNRSPHLRRPNRLASANAVEHPSAQLAVDERPAEEVLSQEALAALPPAEVTDGELMRRVKLGDEQAFREVVERHRNSLVNYLTKLTRCRDRAEEYAQETFVRLYNVADRYEEKGYLAGYLFRIATNLLRSEERRKSRWRTLSDLFQASLPGNTEGTPQRNFLSSEASSVVSAAIAELPMRYRAPLVLREIEGLSYREIAEALDCREGTVKSRISRAKGRLKEQLADYWQGDRS